jgi:hypothetical protein
VPAATFADHQTKRLQDAAQLIVDADTHVDQLVSGDQQRLSFMRVRTFDLHCLEPADADLFNQSTRVAAVGFVGPHRQHRARMAGVETNYRKSHDSPHFYWSTSRMNTAGFPTAC